MDMRTPGIHNEHFGRPGQVAAQPDSVAASYRATPGANRRSVEQRRAILKALGRLDGVAVDVTTIYRELLDLGAPLSMTQLYRGLQTLDDEGFVTRSWLLDEGRPRRGYAI